MYALRPPLSPPGANVASVPNPPRTALVAAALLAVYLVWGSTFVAIRVAVDTLPPFLLAGGRFLVAGTLLFAWAMRRGHAAHGAEVAAGGDAVRTDADLIGPAQWGAATLVGGLLLLGGNGLVVWGEQTVPSGLAALIIAAVPLWMALLGRVLLRQRMTGLSVAGRPRPPRKEAAPELAPPPAGCDAGM